MGKVLKWAEQFILLTIVQKINEAITSKVVNSVVITQETGLKGRIWGFG